MNEKPVFENKVTVSKTRYTIHDTLERLGLTHSYHRVIQLQGVKMCLVPGDKAEVFIFGKTDELVKLVDDNRTDKTTDAELKALLQGWIKSELEKAKKMYKGQWSGFSGFIGAQGEFVLDMHKT